MDFWRVRMKVGGQYERSTEAWDRSEVGGWYGAWTATEWEEARVAQPNDPWLILSTLPHQQELRWDFTPDFGAVRRLEAIGPEDWVVVFMRDRGEIGLARLTPGIHSAENHPLNQVYADGSFETSSSGSSWTRRPFPSRSCRMLIVCCRRRGAGTFTSCTECTGTFGFLPIILMLRASAKL